MSGPSTPHQTMTPGRTHIVPAWAGCPRCYARGGSEVVRHNAVGMPGKKGDTANEGQGKKR